MSKHGSMIAKLLPPGRLLLEPGSVFRRVSDAVGDEFARLEVRRQEALAETDPRTATETLPEWEVMLSLPDEQVTVIPATTAARRAAVTQKYVARGGQDASFFRLLVEACGWYLEEIVLFHSKVLRAGTFRVNDRVYGAEYAYAIEFRVSMLGSVLDALPLTDLERVLRARTHAHITTIVTEA